MNSSGQLASNVIGALPAEILVETFLIVLEGASYRAKSRVPITLLKVCMHFNQVVKSVPMLWTHMVIPPLDDRSTKLDYLQTCFSYSLDLPLNIFIHLSPSASAFGRRKMFQTHLRRFWPALKRCRTLDIYAVQAWKDLTSLFPPELPILATMRLSWSTGVNHDTSTTIRTALPRLRKLCIDGHLMGWALLSTRALTELELSNCTLYDDRGFEWLEFLRSSTRLAKLRLVRVWNNGSVAAIYPALSLLFLHLKTLEMIDIIWVHISSLLRLIAAPYLEELRIHGHALRPLHEPAPPLRFPCLTRLWLQADQYPTGHGDDLLTRLGASADGLTHLFLSLTSHRTATVDLSDAATQILTKSDKLNTVAFRGINLGSIFLTITTHPGIQNVFLHTDLLVIPGAKSPDRFKDTAEELTKLHGCASLRFYGTEDFDTSYARQSIVEMNRSLKESLETMITEEDLVQHWQILNTDSLIE